MVSFWNTLLSREEIQAALSQGERVVYERLASGRQADWLAGRLAGKRAIQDEVLKREGHTVPFGAIEIISGRGVRPTFRIVSPVAALVPADYSLGLSHTGGQGVAALSLIQEEGLVGVDIERERELSNVFVRSFMTETEYREHALSRGQPALLIWCYKEAFLKAFGSGLRVHPRTVETTLDEEGRLISLAHDGKKVAFRAEKITFPGVPFGAIVYVRFYGTTGTYH